MAKGVHATHCCKEHGCKYGDEDCPVYLGIIKQEYPCEYCEDTNEGNEDNTVIGGIEAYRQLVYDIAQDIKEMYVGDVYYTGTYVYNKVLNKQLNKPNSKIYLEVFGVYDVQLDELLRKYGDVDEVDKGVWELKGTTLVFLIPKVAEGDREHLLPFVLLKDACYHKCFTIDAVLEEVLTGKIHSFYGGLEDLHNKVLRYIKITDATNLDKVAEAQQVATAYAFEFTQEPGQFKDNNETIN